MKKIILNLVSKVIMEKVKIWLKENGFVGFTSLIVAGVSAFFGMWLIASGSIGFFVGKNWEIIRKLWHEKYKEEVEDIIDDLKDKVVK